MIPGRALQRAARAVRPSIATQCSPSAVFVPRAILSQLPSPQSANHPQSTAPIQPFSTSQCLHKKGAKPGKSARIDETTPPNSTSNSTHDPFDFSPLEAEIASALERLKTDLSKLRAGGRFNPEILENLRVQPDRNNNQTVKLGDLAQVVPKGRVVQIFVGEKEHIKPITTAILTSRTLNPSLMPQPDPTAQNPLLLILNIPPPTAESRKAAVAEATQAGERASTAVRDARGRMQKKLRAMEKERSVRPDDLRKAQGLMEKVVGKGQGEVRRVVEAGRKVLESG